MVTRGAKLNLQGTDRSVQRPCCNGIVSETDNIISSVREAIVLTGNKEGCTKKKRPYPLQENWGEEETQKWEAHLTMLIRERKKTIWGGGYITSPI